MAEALTVIQDELARLYDLMSGPATDERKALTVTVNQTHLQALRTLPK